jgi:hypothetical protein
MPEGQTVYYGSKSQVRLVFNFDTSAAGPVYITVERGGFPVFPEPVRKTRGRIVLDLGVIDTDGEYVYTVRAEDSLNRVSAEPEYLEFKIAVGGVSINSTFQSVLSNTPVIAG